MAFLLRVPGRFAADRRTASSPPIMSTSAELGVAAMVVGLL
jgi:hypothetical protein